MNTANVNYLYEPLLWNILCKLPKQSKEMSQTSWEDTGFNLQGC